MSAAEPRRGDVWFADVPGDKRRPVVVLTRDSVLPRLTTVLVAPVTTRVRRIPTELGLGPAHGLSRPCVANFDNMPRFPSGHWRAGSAASRRRSSTGPAPRRASPSTAEPPYLHAGPRKVGVRSDATFPFPLTVVAGALLGSRRG